MSHGTNSSRLLIGARRVSAVAAAVLLLAAWGGSVPESEMFRTDEDKITRGKAPVDRGAGPGRPSRTLIGQRQLTSHVPTGTAGVEQTGSFGPAFEWPLIPLHTVLLPDGRVLSYGTDDTGEQSGLLHYSVWDPALGVGPESMLLLPNTTATDLFCAGQALMSNGQVLLVGGDRTVEGRRNFANADVNLFNPADNSLTRQTQSMVYQRWYATVVTTDKAEQVVMGGRTDKSWGTHVPPIKVSYADIPEVYSNGSWRTLTTAQSEKAYGATDDAWSYPKAWLGPDGRVVIFNNTGNLFALSTKKDGKVSKLTGMLPVSRQFQTAAMYAPGKILSMRNNAVVRMVDINGATPVIDTVPNLSQNRIYGFSTVLANGKVWVNGGSSTGNDLVGAAYHSELWNPATNTWTTTATAAKARLYHSVSMLMPDATVLTAGGGAPGPIIQMNAEIYYPPYLYKADGSGVPADRPVIAAAPQAGNWGATVPVVMGDAAPASRVTLVRFGAATHNFNNDMRFMELSFSQTDATLSVQLPSSKTIAPPGYYMVFVFNAEGVPSISKVLRLG